MRKTKRLLLLLGVGVTLLQAIPRVGERSTYKIKLSMSFGKEKPMVMEMLLHQKVKSVDKDGSFVVEITPQVLPPPSQKQAGPPPTPITLKIDKSGKATVLSSAQNVAQLPVSPNMLPSLAGILPLPQKFSKGQTFKVTLPENPKSPLVFKHSGDATYKGKRCSRISMIIPSLVLPSSSPQGEMKTTIKGEGTFLVPLSDNRILQGKITIHIGLKGYLYNPEHKKVPVDSKNTTIVEIEKL